MIDKYAFSTTVFNPLVKSLTRKFIRSGMSEELNKIKEENGTLAQPADNTQVVLVPTPVILTPYGPTVIQNVPQTGGN